MKRLTEKIAALLSVAVIAGCGNNAKPAETTAATTEKTTTAAATTTAAETTALPATTVTKTPVYTAISEKVYYREDSTPGDYGLIFPNVVMRLSSGMYFDSDNDPELFVPDEFLYSGEYADLGTVVQIAAGDRIGTCTVKEASTTLSAPWKDDGPDLDAADGFNPSMITLTLDGELTLTGILRYYYDEQYAISSGDIHFIPDSSYEGMPVPIDISGMETRYGVTDFDPHGGLDENVGYLDETWGGNVCVYSDAPSLKVGNLLTDYADRPELTEFLDGGNANCTKKVEITLTDVELSWNDNFGSTYGCRANIKDVKAKD